MKITESEQKFNDLVSRLNQYSEVTIEDETANTVFPKKTAHFYYGNIYLGATLKIGAGQNQKSYFKKTTLVVSAYSNGKKVDQFSFWTFVRLKAELDASKFNSAIAA